MNDEIDVGISKWQIEGIEINQNHVYDEKFG